MKHICMSMFLLLSILLFSARTSQSQEFDDFAFEDMEEDNRANAHYDYFGLGAGYTGMYSPVISDDLASLTGDLGLQPEINNLLLHGWTVYAGLPSFRLAYFHVSGSAETKSVVTINNAIYERTLRLRRDIGAGQLGIPIGLARPQLWLFPGIMIGEITQRIEVDQQQAGTLFFDSLYNASHFDGTQPNTITNLSSSHSAFFLQPSLTVEYGLLPYVLIFRAGAGYGFGLGGDWEDNSGRVLEEGPEIKNNINIHFGVSLDIAGLIAYSISSSVQGSLN